MPVLISMLRGVNLGSHNKINMGALRALYEALKFEDPRTYVQSGNVIFRSKEKISPALAKKIQNAIGREFGCRPEVILRATDELRKAIAASPFPASRGLEPGKVLVTFLNAEPGPEAHATLLKFKNHPEEIHLKGRELYIYFPDGAGRSKLPWSSGSTIAAWSFAGEGKRVAVVQGSHGDIEVVSCSSSRCRIGHRQPCADLVFLPYIVVPGVPSAGRALP